MIIMSNIVNVTGKGGGIHAIGSTISVYDWSLLTTLQEKEVGSALLDYHHFC